MSNSINNQVPQNGTTSNTTTQQGAGSSNGNNGRTTSSRRVDPMWAVNSIAKKYFKRIPSSIKSTETKLACIKAAISEHSDLCADEAKYFTWVLEQAKRLRRVFDFDSTCNKDGVNVNPQYVAEHLILLGKRKWTEIQLEGLEKTVPDSDIRMYGVSRLVPAEYDFSHNETENKEGNANE